MIELFIESSKIWQVPLHLLLALCTHESHLDPNLYFLDGKSPSIGLCSVKMIAAKDIDPSISEAELQDPKTNLDIAAAYLRKHYNTYKSWNLALAAYNAGRVKKDAQGNLINEDYVKKVLTTMKQKKWKKYIRKHDKSLAIMGVRG